MAEANPAQNQEAEEDFVDDVRDQMIYCKLENGCSGIQCKTKERKTPHRHFANSRKSDLTAEDRVVVDRVLETLKRKLQRICEKYQRGDKYRMGPKFHNTGPYNDANQRLNN